MENQEEYLSKTNLKDVALRGLKKMTTEVTSIKTLFIGVVFVGIFCGKINDLTGLIVGLAALGAKEVPPELFSAIITKFTGK